MLSAVMEKHNGTVVQNQDWFCVKGRCPIFEGTTLIKFDAWHPSAAFVLDIVPVIWEDFAALMAGAPAGGTPTETPATEEPTAETPTDELVE